MVMGFKAAEITKKNELSWDVTPYGSCTNLSFVRKNRLHHQGGKYQTAGLILCTLMMRRFAACSVNVAPT
jgi:hypothetical protein